MPNTVPTLRQLAERDERVFPSYPQVARYFPGSSIEDARNRLGRAIERGNGPAWSSADRELESRCCCKFWLRSFTSSSTSCCRRVHGCVRGGLCCNRFCSNSVCRTVRATKVNCG